MGCLVFTSHYVSIKTVTALFCTTEPTEFTSHYVSIKTQTPHQGLHALSHLHPTMYLLKRLLRSALIQSITNLHPTMYLLKRIDPSTITRDLANLHPTMYLLKPRQIFL